MQNKKHKRYPLNVDGEFYVEDGCCIVCDLPRETAPELFELNKEKDHCYVSKQPNTEGEMNQMIEAMSGAEVFCIRCSTRNKELKKKLREAGLQDQLDEN